MREENENIVRADSQKNNMSVIYCWMSLGRETMRLSAEVRSHGEVELYKMNPTKHVNYGSEYQVFWENMF